MTDVTTITSKTCVRFLVRIMRTGDRYGLDDRLTHDEGPGREMVEFYDTRYPHTKFGQFVSRYYVSTILSRDGYGTGRGGLDLQTDVAAWKIDPEAMDVVRLWLCREVTP